eukprot:COSAG05_NODE_12147_length_481_cov_1.167539_2_plen_72_part_01
MRATKRAVSTMSLKSTRMSPRGSNTCIYSIDYMCTRFISLSGMTESSIDDRPRHHILALYSILVASIFIYLL